MLKVRAGLTALWYNHYMNKKLAYVKTTDKKLVKKLAKDLQPALISLSQK